MRRSLGETRTSVRDRHALISPDSHERTTLANWPGCDLTFVITPQMGSRFTQYFADIPAQCTATGALPGVQRLLFVVSGRLNVLIDGTQSVLREEGYAFVPDGSTHQLRAEVASRVVVFEKPYIRLTDHNRPHAFVAHAQERPAAPMKGDDRLMLQKLLPVGLEHDFEVNIMEFAPGASLPYVETHFMEHGLLMLNGGGIYRLDEAWYSVETGDVIWMGPFCPQWFGAIGRTNARYLIYKNWNRDPYAGSTI